VFWKKSDPSFSEHIAA